MLEDLKGSIRVFCRSRPLTEDDTSKGHRNVLSFGDDEMSITVTDGKKSKSFNYDRVFGPSSSQDEVFRDTSVSLLFYFLINIC